MKKKIKKCLAIFTAVAALNAVGLLGACDNVDGVSDKDGQPTDPFAGYIDLHEKQIYEAEDADTLENGCFVGTNSNCSGGMRLENMTASNAAYAEYIVNSDKAGYADLSVKIAYVRNETSMGKVMAVSVNGEELGLSNAPVYHIDDTYNSYYEFPLGRISLKKGENTVRFESVGGGFHFDYFALSTPEVYSGGVLKLEAENASTASVAYPANDSAASSGRVLNQSTAGKFTVTVYAKKPVLSELVICFAYAGKSGAKRFNEMMAISVNGRTITLDDRTISPHDGAAQKYNTISIGNILLQGGENKIVVNSYSSYLFYDSFLLTETDNTDVEPRAETIIQAEHAALTGGCRIEQKGGIEAVVDNSPNSAVTFLLYAESDFSAEFAIRLNYTGSENTLEKVMYITVNGYLVNLLDTEVESSTVSYTESYIGEIPLFKGENIVVITSIDGNYKLDYIMLW